MKRTRNLYHYAIRRCKKSVELIKKNKLLETCINGKGNIFDEFRKIRNVKRDLPQAIDDSNNIPDEFANVYKKLYNSTPDQDETLNILGNVDTSIDILSFNDVDLVTSDIVRKAAEQVKANRNDPVFTFNSDCIKRAPATLFQHLANTVRIFLIRGYVSKVLLVAMIVPLIKDKLGDTESSDNYRSIALSSILLNHLCFACLPTICKPFHYVFEIYNNKNTPRKLKTELSFECHLMENFELAFGYSIPKCAKCAKCACILHLFATYITILCETWLTMSSL